MRIGLDIDGCLADFNKGFAKLLEQTANVKLPEVNQLWPDMWEWTEFLHGHGVTTEHQLTSWRLVNDAEQHFWSMLDPYPEAVDIAETIQLLDNEHDIYFVTSRPGKGAKMQTECWLEELGVPHPTVLISHSKGYIAKGLELDVFVDDKPDNLHDVIKACGLGVKCYLVNRPWNTNVFVNRYITKVSSMLEVVDKIYQEDNVEG